MPFRFVLAVLAALTGACSIAAAQPSGAGGGPGMTGPAEDAAIWFYAVQSKTLGPHTLAELRGLCTEGIIRRDTQVYHPDFNWRLARDVPELRDLFVTPTPPPPPPPPPGPPPPAAPVQNYDQQAADYLVGAWNYGYPQTINGMTMDVRYELSFRAGTNAGGELTGMEYVTIPPMEGSPRPVTGAQPINGTWSVRAFNETSFMLTVQYNANQPFTDSFAMIDANTLRSSQGHTMSRRP